MEHETDCEVAAIATACQVSYDKAETALGWKDLPGNLENPIFGNPINLHIALLRLGHWKINRTLDDILSGRCEPGKTVVLVKKSVTVQHWAVLASSLNGIVGLYMGKKAYPNYYTKDQIVEMFNNGSNLDNYKGPFKEAFEVYKCGFLELVWRKIKAIFKKFD